MKIEMKAGNKTCLSFYGPICEGWSEKDKCFDEKTVKNLLSGINADDELEVMVNSPGGQVFSALAINGLLSQHKGQVTIHVAGLAASAATIITSLKNAKCVIDKGSMMMIHNPSSSVAGTSDDLKHEADVLDKSAQSIRNIYAQKTGLDEKKIKQLMDAETWLTAEEAVELGFADELNESEPVTACLKGGHILAVAGYEWDLDNLSLHFPKEKLMAKDNITKSAVANAEPTAHVEQKADKAILMTAIDLKNNHPDLYQQIVKEASTKERERIKALVDIDIGSNHDIVVKAMFDEPKTAEQVAIESLKDQKQQLTNSANQLQKDGESLADDLADVGMPIEGALPKEDAQSQKDQIVNSVKTELARLAKSK